MWGQLVVPPISRGLFIPLALHVCFGDLDMPCQLVRYALSAFKAVFQHPTRLFDMDASTCGISHTESGFVL